MWNQNAGGGRGEEKERERERENKTEKDLGNMKEMLQEKKVTD